MISVIKKYALLAFVFGAFGSVFGASSGPMGILFSSLRLSEEDCRLLETEPFIAVLTDQTPSAHTIESLKKLALQRLVAARAMQANIFEKVALISAEKASDSMYLDQGRWGSLLGVLKATTDKVVQDVGLFVAGCEEVARVVLAAASLEELRLKNLNNLESPLFLKKIGVIRGLGVLEEELKKKDDFIKSFTLQPCKVCSKTQEKDGIRIEVCARCKAVFYCSEVCQRADWKAGHKNTCVPVDSAKK